MKKQFKFAVKALTENGSFEGLASTYGNTDLGGDVVEPGAFAKTLSEKSSVPILWSHDIQEPIGIGKLTDSPQGLIVKGELALEVPAGQKAYALLKRGIVQGLSIGYDVVKQRFVGEIRKLQEVKLWEVSLVVFPMNPESQVTAVKNQDRLSAEVKSFRNVLADCRKQFLR